MGALIVVPLVAVAVMCVGLVLENKSKPEGSEKIAEIKSGLR